LYYKPVIARIIEIVMKRKSSPRFLPANNLSKPEVIENECIPPGFQCIIFLGEANQFPEILLIVDRFQV
jgi:hypothetical protein